MCNVIEEADSFIQRMESLEESSSGETVHDDVVNQILHDLVNARDDIAAHLWELDDYFLQLKR